MPVCLKYIATAQGFIKFENNAYSYVYQYKDQVDSRDKALRKL